MNILKIIIRSAIVLPLLASAQECVDQINEFRARDGQGPLAACGGHSMYMAFTGACIDRDNAPHTSWKKLGNALCPKGRWLAAQNGGAGIYNPVDDFCTWEDQVRCWYDEKTGIASEASCCGPNPHTKQHYDNLMGHFDCVACAMCTRGDDSATGWTANFCKVITNQTE